MATRHELARRSELFPRWPMDDGSSSPRDRALCRERPAVGLAVAKTPGAQAELAGAVVGATGGAPEGVWHVGGLPGVPS